MPTGSSSGARYAELAINKRTKKSQTPVASPGDGGDESLEWAPPWAIRTSGTSQARVGRSSVMDDYSVETFSTDSAEILADSWVATSSRLLSAALNILRKRRFRSTQLSCLRALWYQCLISNSFHVRFLVGGCVADGASSPQRPIRPAARPEVVSDNLSQFRGPRLCAVASPY